MIVNLECKLLIARANVVGYADEIVLLALSWMTLQNLIYLALKEVIKIDMICYLKDYKVYDN